EIASVAGEIRNGLIKLIVTRGSGGRGYRPQVGMNATRILMTYPLPTEPDILTRAGGIRVGTAATRLARQPWLAGLKHLNRLEQVLAAGEPGEFEERVMLDTEGNVIDGTMMNLFLIERGVLITPDLSMAGVAGIMRRRIIELAATVGIQCEERDVQPAELERADEVFMCNAVRGIRSVIRIDNRPLEVGSVTGRLSAALAGVWP
ncbi:MAG TPA: aminodeoxychorismate lyase, partial [Gammaproteobacteria bacterium]|nr:aminodeoxychorismate lyase [Gammaproteobacteria bacterium]